MGTSKRFFYLFFGLIFIAVYTFLNWQSLPKITTPQTECANSISCVKNLTGKFDPAAKAGSFMGQKINVPQTLSQGKTPPILGETTGKEKHIYCDRKTNLPHFFV